MDLPRLVVLEQGRRWVDSIRARMRDLPVRVVHTTLARECLELVRGQARTTLVIELPDRPLAALELLEQVRQLDGHAGVLVVARSDQGGLELAVRELGAAAFLCEPVSPAEVAELAEQLFRCRPVPGPATTPTGKLESGLS